VSRRVAIAIAVLVSVARTIEAARVTVDDLMRLRSIVDVRISPDGAQVAYAVSTPSLERNAHEAALYVVATGGGGPARRLAEETRVFTARLPTPKVRWSPDGASISFLGLAGDKPQVFAVAASGGQARALTTAPEGAFAYEWAPDGKSLAYLMRDPVSDEEQRQRKDMSFVTHVGAPDPAARLWLQALGATPARVLTPPGQYVDSFSWSPDGRELAYAAAPTSGFMSQYSTRLYAVPAAGGTPRAIVDRPGMNTMPQFSPDGALVAFVSTNGRAELMASRGLAVAPARGGPSAIRAFGLDDAWVSDIVWARDSRSVYVLTNDGKFAQGERMFDQPIVRVFLDSGRAERVAGTANFSPSLTRDGARLAYRAVDGPTMGDVVVRETASGKTAKLTDVNPELRSLELGEQKVVSWKSFDGMEIWGLLVSPPKRPTGRPVPLLVYCHGGPGGGVTWGLFPQFMQTVGQVDPYGTEAMASAGFAILFPMPRGGAGYGEAGQRAIVNSWGEADYKDIMTGVDALVARGIADPDRLGVMGASYGGFMTDWIVTQTGRFKAASTAASISDLADQYFLSDGGDFMAEYFKRPWEARESYFAHSPLNFAKNVTTPLLIQHGERDLRVPIAQAWKFYRALKALGKTVEFDIYPRSSHLYYEPMLEREAMKRNLEWFTRWIQPAP
jgi:dipeptidyl aminopeptidase/acylaminoacyl peptidase